jgi:hypothetical protein
MDAERLRSGQTHQTVNLAAYAFEGSNPSLSTIRGACRLEAGKVLSQVFWYAGVAQLARASAFQAEGRGFESLLPLQKTDSAG